MIKRETPIAVSLGCNVIGAALPMPDIRDVETAKQGAMKRFCRDPPHVNHEVYQDIRTYVVNWLHKNMTPLALDTDVSVSSWLEHAPYPQSRKDELLWLYNQNDCVTNRDYECKSFIKTEGYETIKSARVISSRSDQFKILTGPYFKAIEKELFARPEFIKHIPVMDRPDYIYNYLQKEGCSYVETDHTAFEAHMTSEIMEVIEFQLYEYMLQNVYRGPEIMKHIRKALAGVNICRLNGLVVRLKGTRMSGDMCTSLGNGFTNLMVMSYMCHKLGYQVQGVVEGDDGLFRIDGLCPSIEDFSKLGFNLKLKLCESLSTSSFCGMVFDQNTRENLSDPKEILVKFGWTTSACKFGGPPIMLGLLRAKALSLLYELPGCPIARSLAQMALRVTDCDVKRKMRHLGQNYYSTSKVKPIFVNSSGQMDYWDSQIFNGIIDPSIINEKLQIRLSKPITSGSRGVVERLYNVSIHHQLAIEKYLDGITSLQQLNSPEIKDIMALDWYKIGDRYLHKRVVGSIMG